jgi:hypothetical protein
VGAGEVQLVVGGGAGDHPRAHQPAELDGRQPRAAGGAEDGQGFAGLQVRPVLQGVKAGAVGHHEAGRLLVRDPVRHPHHATDGRDDPLAAAPPAEEGGRPLADSQARHALPHRVDDARAFPAGREGALGLELVAVDDDQGVEEVQADRADGEPHLPRPGLRVRQVGERQRLGAARRCR